MSKKIIIGFLIISFLLVSVHAIAGLTGPSGGGSPTVPGSFCKVDDDTWQLCNSSDTFGDATYPIADGNFTALTIGTLSSGNITMSDDAWIGNGAAKGRIVFDDDTLDKIELTAALVQIGDGTFSWTHTPVTSGVGIEGILEVDGNVFLDAALSVDGVTTVGDAIVSDTADTDDLGSATKEWQDFYLGTGKIYLYTDQGETIYSDGTDLNITAGSNINMGATDFANNAVINVGDAGNDFGATNTLMASTINAATEPGLTITMTNITGTDNQAIDITGGEALGSQEHWTGIRVKPDNIDPSAADTRIRGLAVNLSGVNTAHIPESIEGIRVVMPDALTGLARAVSNAIHITEGDIQHDFSVPATAGEQFTAYDMVIDSGSLHANSEIHGFDISTANGSPSGMVAAIGTHTYIDPIHQHIGTYSTPNQNLFAGKSVSGTWYDGDHPSPGTPETLNAHEMFETNADWIAVGSAATFSEIEVIMGTPGTKTVSPTFWYSTGASTWTEFFPEDATIGFTQSGLIHWTLADISGSWTGDGDPSNGEVTPGYWIKILRTGAPDPGTPTPTTIKTGTIVLYSWDKTGILTIKDVTGETFTSSDLTSGRITLAGASGVLTDDIDLSFSGAALTLGSNGTDGQLNLFSEQGGTDYTASLLANAAMTSAASFYLPADEPVGTYLLNMTTGGVIGYDSSTYLTGNETITLSGDVTGSGATAITTAIGADVVDFADIKYNNTLAGNPAFLVDECYFLSTATGGGFICEGSTADTQEQIYQFPDVNGADTTNFIVVDGTQVTDLEGTALSITTGTLNVTEADPLSATKALDNLASVAISESLTSDTANTDDLGTEAKYWKKGFFASEMSFEGATDNDHQTTFSITDPTSDRTITIQNAGGIVAMDNNAIWDFEGTGLSIAAGQLSAHVAVTVTGEDFLSLSTQAITANAINPDNLANDDFGPFSCNGTTCAIDALAIVENDLAASLAFDDGDLLDFGTFVTGNSEGIMLPAHASDCSTATAEGQICWQEDTKKLYVGDGAAAVEINPAAGSGDLLADGTIPLTANWDVGAFTITGTQFISDIAGGTAPFVVTSSTEVANLKAATVGTIAGLAPDTATTQATQAAITSLGTLTGIVTSGDIDMANTKAIGIADNELITFNTAGTIVVSGGIFQVDAIQDVGNDATLSFSGTNGIDVVNAFTAGTVAADTTVSGTTITASTGFALGTGDYIGITGNEVLTFAEAGTITVGGATLVTSGNIELGHATDTTVARSSAGVLAVEGVVLPSISSTNTLTNKRITPRVTTEASSATPTINTDNSDAHSITALAAAITSMTTNLTGTPTNFQKLTIRILDNGTARAITWGASFQAMGVALPTTTTISKVLTTGFIWDSADNKWGCVASVEEE